MTINAKIKAAIDSQFDTWHKQLNNKSVTLEEMLDIIGTEFLNSLDKDTEEIAKYRCDKLNYLEELAMKLEEETIDTEEDEVDDNEVQGSIDEDGVMDDEEKD